MVQVKMITKMITDGTNKCFSKTCDLIFSSGFIIYIQLIYMWDKQELEKPVVSDKNSLDSLWPWDIIDLAQNWISSLQWRHNGHDSVSNHQPHDCLLKRLFRRRSKKTSKLRVTGLCAGNSPGTGEFPAQMASNAENVSIWWSHHVINGLLSVYHQAITWTYCWLENYEKKKKKKKLRLQNQLLGLGLRGYKFIHQSLK